MTVGQYQVVCNDEEQYSIWPAGREQAPGWHAAGFTGSQEDCLAFIREVWTDLRPRSVRETMERASSRTFSPR